MASHKVTEAKRKIKVMSENILRKVMGVNELPIRMGRAKVIIRLGLRLTIQSVTYYGTTCRPWSTPTNEDKNGVMMSLFFQSEKIGG